MSVLQLAVILALATDSACGAAAPGSEFAQRLAAIAIHESAGGHPFAVGVNGPGGGAHLFNTAAEAIAFARALDAQGRDYDAGLLQINKRQFARHGLTVESAFDACRSMKAGADHYAADVRSVWTLAHRRYNTGGTERGAAYAASVEAVLARVRTADAAPAVPTASSSPSGWDVWDNADHRSGRADVVPSPQAAPPPAERPQTAPVVMLQGLIAQRTDE